MVRDEVVFYGNPAKFWSAALLAFVFTIAWLALDVWSGYSWSAQPPLVLMFGLAFFATPLLAAFAVSNSLRIANSDWRGVFGLLTFAFVAPLHLVVLGNVYFLLGGEV